MGNSFKSPRVPGAPPAPLMGAALLDSLARPDNRTRRLPLGLLHLWAEDLDETLEMKLELPPSPPEQELPIRDDLDDLNKETEEED